MELPHLKCAKCGYEWMPRVEKPKKCPKCGNRIHTCNTEKSRRCLDDTFRLSGKRKHTSIRCDEALWEGFMGLVRANGLSSCDILEKLLIGFCVGYEYYAKRVAQPTTINVIVDAPCIIKRVRRRQLVIEDEITVCGFRSCEEPAVGSGVWRDKGEFLLCEKHLLEAKNDPTQWKVI